MSDIVERLRELERLKTGDPLPEWMPESDWGKPLSKFAGKVADKIENLLAQLAMARQVQAKSNDEIIRLRSIAGKADVGQSFAKLTSEIRHQTPDNG